MREPLSGRGPVTGDKAVRLGAGAAPALKLTALGLVLLSVVLLAGCGGADDTASIKNTGSQATAPGGGAPKSDEGSIRATPNPVPPGDGNGKSTITWSTKGSLGDVKVYVSADGEPEKLFAQASEGSAEAPWIQTGMSYEFRLYAEQGGNRRLLDKVLVTRAQ